jgi:membrane-bound inhibitor of C-type lysozyme
VRLTLALVFAAPALPTAAQDVPEASVVGYRCAGGASLAVAYINPPGGDSYAVVAHDGALVPMKAGPTGSGVRYLSLDGSGLVWHTKGDEGFLARDADMAMIAEDCTAAGG